MTIGEAPGRYLEWLLECGLIAGLLIAVWLLLYVRQWGWVWKRGEWTPFRFAQAGGGIALLLMMLHSLADFNLRIPANAVFTALLAAVFFHRSLEEERQRSSRRRVMFWRRQWEANRVLRRPALFPPENQANPFAG